MEDVVCSRILVTTALRVAPTIYETSILQSTLQSILFLLEIHRTMTKYKFSPNFADPKGSPIRALSKHMREPGMISFGGGFPDPALFDVKGLEEASIRAYQNSRVCLGYGLTAGIPQIKAEIVRLMQRRGSVVDPENTVVTTGSQQAFDLVLRVLISAGDLVYIEQPTYSTSIEAFKSYHARMTSIPVDADGLDVAALEVMLAQAAQTGNLPALLYTIPTFSNPSGATLTVARRLRLLELAVQYEFLVVEDDPYGDLRFSGEEVPSLLSLAPQVPGAQAWIIHLASLSKIISPGLRVGWAIGPFEIMRRCTVAKESADFGSSPWMQSIAAEYLASDKLDGHLLKIRAAYGAKCAALAVGLRECLGDAISFHEPAGGMFIWARLNGGLTAAALLQEAIPRKVLFVPGEGFQAENPDAGASERGSAPLRRGPQRSAGGNINTSRADLVSVRDVSNDTDH
jgi:DNA-binding transcriptional MocR family regulator